MRTIARAIALAAVASMLVLGPAAAKSSGKIVFGSNRADGDRELYVVNEDGSGEHRLTFNDVFERQPIWSPDGTRIAFAGLKDGNWDIYTIDATGGDLRRLTTDPARDDYPKWTSDGRIVFERGNFACPCRAWIVNPDGTGEAEIPLGNDDIWTPEPSRRGNKLAYSRNLGGILQLFVSRLDGSGSRQVIVNPGGGGDFNARWSPTGDDLVFLRDVNNVDNDIYVVGANGKGLKRLTNTPDRVEFWPAWSSDGREILFQTGDGHLRAVSVSTGQERAVATAPTAPLGDDFGDGVRDASLWHQINDPGGTIGETGGRLVASISGTAVPGGQFNQIDEHIGSQCSLTGDFDFQVDYSLLTWPRRGGFIAQLSAFFGNAAIARTSTTWNPQADEQYSGWSDGGNGAFTTRTPRARSGSSGTTAS